VTEQLQPREAGRATRFWSWRSPWVAPALLMVLSCAVQLVVLARPTVPAPDCVRFVTLAQTIQQEGPLAALAGRHEQPLFPLAVWLGHAVLAWLLGDGPSLWRLSAQGVSSAALVLAVAPVYLISRQLYGRRAALIGSVLFCVLPHVARLGPQGIGDSLHLLLFGWAAWGILIALRPDGRGAVAVEQEGDSRPCDGEDDRHARRILRPAWMIVPGLATAVALLVRAEVVVLAAAVPLTLLALQAVPRWRGPWRSRLAGCAWYGLGLLAVGLPYAAVFQTNGSSEALRRLLGRPNTSAVQLPPDMRVAYLHLVDGLAPSFAIKESGTLRRCGVGAVLRLFGEELSRAYWYWVGLLALYGLWAARRLQGRPADAFVRVFVLLDVLLTLAFVMREGYLQARHFAPLVMLTIGWAGYGVVMLASRLAGWAGSLRPAFRAAERRTIDGPARAAVAVTVLAAVGCLAYFGRPVGEADEAHRAAGQWLAAQGPGLVIDTRGLTGLFSGHPTALYSDTPAMLFDPRLGYFVVETWEHQVDTDRGHTLRTLLEAGAEKVHVFAAPPVRDRCRDVEVYRWRAEAFAQFHERLVHTAEIRGVTPPGWPDTERPIVPTADRRSNAAHPRGTLR